MKTVLTSLTPAEIAAELELKPFQGRQIFCWIHQKQVFDFEAMTNLSKALRTHLSEQYAAVQMTPLEVQESAVSGTKKVLLGLPDGDSVESVLIRDRDRITLCVSSQVGCPLKCAFCATGQAGFTRNLSAGEIVEQALFLLAGENLEGRTPNIVYMGMGEPFWNYDEVIKSIRLFMDENGLNIGARKITVSTVGEVKGIERFAEEDWQVRLSISLHAANDALRSRLVPLSRKYPLGRLREAIELYLSKTGRQITFEWTLLDGVNDSLDDARELVEYIGELKAVVNLIPWNPVPGMDFRPSPDSRCDAFLEALNTAGVKVTLRREKGQDIDAACGQLRSRQPKT